MRRHFGLFILMLAIPTMVIGSGDPQDPKNWSPIKIPGKQRAPEFEDITEWVNSPALTMKELKGKVVVVHFMAFNCINCIHNYPWYKSVWKDFKEKGVVVIAIHTPETEGEKNTKTLQKKLKEAELTFPVAVDNKKTMWDRYANSVWPSVYIIDKNGISRWGWQGELSWKGAKGETLMRAKIEELLKE